uniref:Periviscerokinin-3 n=1 Tax=Therea petiveriana TaxID=45965 RepID=PVK3_THEPT|nr:RecName: Full=Periviscerokinin-3; Short=ThePe-PVK-3 [Therea petiveriana]
GSSGLISMTRV